MYDDISFKIPLFEFALRILSRNLCSQAISDIGIWINPIYFVHLVFVLCLQLICQLEKRKN
jgi:hypothetical protein